MGMHFHTGVLRVNGSGDSPVSMTGRADIARFLVHVLTHLSPSRLDWSVFRIEADRMVRYPTAEETPGQD
jgi:hypothetical protein